MRVRIYLVSELPDFTLVTLLYCVVTVFVLCLFLTLLWVGLHSLWLAFPGYTRLPFEIERKAKIRNLYNQISYLTRNTILEIWCILDQIDMIEKLWFCGWLFFINTTLANLDKWEGNALRTNTKIWHFHENESKLVVGNGFGQTKKTYYCNVYRALQLLANLSSWTLCKMVFCFTLIANIAEVYIRMQLCVWISNSSYQGRVQAHCCDQSTSCR